MDEISIAVTKLKSTSQWLEEIGRVNRMTQKRNNLKTKTAKQAFLYFNAGDFFQAANTGLDALKDEVDQPDLLQMVAISYAQQKDLDEANRYFEAAIRVAPYRRDIRFNYANALREQKRFSEAEKQCKDSILLGTPHPEQYNILGNIYLSSDDFVRAEAAFRKALSLKPRFVQALNNLGIALQHQGRSQQAIEVYNEALKAYPDYVDSLNNLGIILMMQEKTAEAYSCFEKTLRLKPNHSTAAHYAKITSPSWMDSVSGKNITIRGCTENDAEFIAGAYNDREFMLRYNRYLTPPRDIEILKIHLRKSSQLHPCHKKSVDWVIYELTTNKPIGLICLADVNFQHMRAELLTGILHAKDRNQGYGIEATLLAFDFAFNHVKLEKITSFVYSDNPIPQKNSLGIGFSQEGYLKSHIIDSQSGKYLDVFLNGLTIDAFRANEKIGRLSVRLLGRDIRSCDV